MYIRNKNAMNFYKKKIIDVMKKLNKMVCAWNQNWFSTIINLKNVKDSVAKWSSKIISISFEWIPNNKLITEITHHIIWSYQYTKF